MNTPNSNYDLIDHEKSNPNSILSGNEDFLSHPGLISLVEKSAEPDREIEELRREAFKQAVSRDEYEYILNQKLKNNSNDYSAENFPSIKTAEVANESTESELTNYPERIIQIGTLLRAACDEECKKRAA